MDFKVFSLPTRSLFRGSRPLAEDLESSPVPLCSLLLCPWCFQIPSYSRQAFFVNLKKWVTGWGPSHLSYPGLLNNLQEPSTLSPIKLFLLILRIIGLHLDCWDEWVVNSFSDFAKVIQYKMVWSSSTLSSNRVPRWDSLAMTLSWILDTFIAPSLQRQRTRRCLGCATRGFGEV